VIRDLRPATVFAFLVGLALGALAAWSGSILAPVIAHFLINFLNIRWLTRPEEAPS
jgi:membrane protease YdiL (CAAX protease family)